MNHFTISDSLLGDLAARYFGGACGDMIDLLAIFSALSGGLAAVLASSRILFAIFRDLVPSNPLGKLSQGSGVPRNGAFCVILTALFLYSVMRKIFNAKGLDAFFWASTVGALSLLVVYLLVVLSTMVSLIGFPGGEKRWKVFIPGIATVAIIYTFWVNVYPVQPGAYGVIPWIVILWCLLPMGLLLLKPQLADRITSRFLNKQ